MNPDKQTVENRMSINTEGLPKDAKKLLRSVMVEIEEENEGRKRELIKERVRELNAAERTLRKLRQQLERDLRKDLDEFDDALYR